MAMNLYKDFDPWFYDFLLKEKPDGSLEVVSHFHWSDWGYDRYGLLPGREDLLQPKDGSQQE